MHGNEKLLFIVMEWRSIINASPVSLNERFQQFNMDVKKEKEVSEKKHQLILHWTAVDIYSDVPYLQTGDFSTEVILWLNTINPKKFMGFPGQRFWV